MPRKPINWANTIIYVIRSLADPTLIYVGSTTDYIKRKCNHKNNCKLSQIKLYVMIRDNGGWDNFVMTEHSNFPCENKRQAEKEEERIRLELQANLNMRRAFITPEQQKIEKAEYCEKYYEKNKNNIDAKHKEYYEENKAELLEYQKEYYEENKDEIKEKHKENITCECGCIITKGTIARHRKTQKHKNLLNL